jgi:hypothetical protein
MAQSDSNGTELAVLSAAERKLAACTDLHEVLEIRDTAETIRYYAQKRRRPKIKGDRDEFETAAQRVGHHT